MGGKVLVKLMVRVVIFLGRRRCYKENGALTEVY